MDFGRQPDSDRCGPDRDRHGQTVIGGIRFSLSVGARRWPALVTPPRSPAHDSFLRPGAANAHPAL